MPWVIGIDEAGYGPNLGPLVLGSVALHVPEAEGCLWHRLRPAVRKACDPDDGRLVVDDSKKVYAGPGGLARLERSALSLLAPKTDLTVGDYLALAGVGPTTEDLRGEAWFTPAESLPVADDGWPACTAAVKEAVGGCGVGFGPARNLVIPAPRFNTLLDHWGNKAAVEAEGVIALLREALSLPGDEPLHFAVDRLGGRTYYAAIIQTAFPDGWVQAHQECAEVCRYSVLGLAREVHLRFQPRADGEHLTVALASMGCKYLREVCMGQFNRFWQARVPGLEPTAGYPGDAARFYGAIRGAMVEQGISQEQVWRRK